MGEFLKKSVDINVLGQNIRIKHEDEDYIRDLENFVNQKLEVIEKQQKVTNIQLAARVLVVIADDYLSMLKEKENLQQVVEEKAKKLIHLIDEKAVMT